MSDITSITSFFANTKYTSTPIKNLRTDYQKITRRKSLGLKIELNEPNTEILLQPFNDERKSFAEISQAYIDSLNVGDIDVKELDKKCRKRYRRRSISPFSSNKTSKLPVKDEREVKNVKICCLIFDELIKQSFDLPYRFLYIVTKIDMNNGIELYDNLKDCFNDNERRQLIELAPPMVLVACIKYLKKQIKALVPEHLIKRVAAINDVLDYDTKSNKHTVNQSKFSAIQTLYLLIESPYLDLLKNISLFLSLFEGARCGLDLFSASKWLLEWIVDDYYNNSNMLNVAKNMIELSPDIFNAPIELANKLRNKETPIIIKTKSKRLSITKLLRRSGQITDYKGECDLFSIKKSKKDNQIIQLQSKILKNII